MFTVVSVTLGRDLTPRWCLHQMCCDSLKSFLMLHWMSQIDPSETFALFKQMLKTSDEKEKPGFLCLMGRSTDFLWLLRWHIFFPDSPSKYILKIFFVHYNLILWLYVRVCPALLQSLLRRLLFPAFVAPAITTWTPLRSRSPRLSSFRCRSISACRSLTDTSTMRGSAQTQRHYKIHCCPLFP